jgi:hypothetical protein
LIDSFSYIHIFFRHYAASLKEYQTDKSYHYDRKIDYKELPTFLSYIIQSFKDSVSSDEFNGEKITFILNETTYVIWFKLISQSTIHPPLLRVQTFYPVEKQIHIKKIETLKRINVNQVLSFLI